MKRFRIDFGRFFISMDNANVLYTLYCCLSLAKCEYLTKFSECLNRWDEEMGKGLVVPTLCSILV